MNNNRVVTLRSETRGRDSRSLWARMTDEGDLRIDGQDLGPATAPVSPDGEYEWVQVVRRADLPDLLALLGADPGVDVLEFLEASWSGTESYSLEKLLRESDLEVELYVL